MTRNYYIIGSKYGENIDQDIFPLMLEKNTVSVGYAWDHDLAKFFGKPETEIIEYLKKEGEKSASYSALKYFLNLREGDLIAIKGTGSPVGKKARLTIRGYAVVKESDGKIYEHNPTELGHLVYVNFFEKEIYKELELGYGKTIHKLKEPKHIKEIFGAYFEPDSTARTIKGVTTKNINPYTRTVHASNLIVTTAHNKLQLQL